jgi:hypothetical protein
MNAVHIALLSAVGSTVILLVMAFGTKEISPGWVQYTVLGIAMVLMVASDESTAILAGQGLRKASYAEELVVVRQALTLTHKPRVVVRDLHLLGTGRELDRFALTRLRRAVATEKRREERLRQNPYELRAQKKIAILLTPKKG